MSDRDPRQRRHSRQMAALVGAIAVVAGAAVAIGLGYAIGGSDDPGPATVTATSSTTPATTSAQQSRVDTAGAKTNPTADAVPAAKPVVWVQAGHVPPGEPGYMAQTGAAGEAEFNTRVRSAVIAALRAKGVDAKPLGARVEPLGAAGAAFVSVHHDSRNGAAVIGYAVPGGENYYHGEGTGDASPTPYRDSAPHRKPATVVTPKVEAASRALAEDVARTFGAVFTPANGANGNFKGVESSTGNRRLMHFYGYYRTNADARILVECGAPGADDAFLAQPRLIGRAIAAGILDYLGSSDAGTATPASTTPSPESSGGSGTKAPLPPKPAR